MKTKLYAFAILAALSFASASVIFPAFTSWRCSECGTVDRKARESQAVFRCRSCGYSANADLNAARNIAAGHAARGGPGLPRPANREPQLPTFHLA